MTNDCVFIDDSLVSYKLKKQQTVSRYFTEAKYKSMENATYEMVWLMSLSKDLGVSHEGLAMLFCDNQATLHIAANPVFHKRIKHIKIGCHLVQEKIQNRTFSTPSSWFIDKTSISYLVYVLTWQNGCPVFIIYTLHFEEEY